MIFQAKIQVEFFPIELGPRGVIYLDLVSSMLSTDFASASVLISFGAVIGTTTPLQVVPKRFLPGFGNSWMKCCAMP